MGRQPPAAISFFEPVQDQLLLVETILRAQADQEIYPDLHAALQNLLASGGKRVRPALALLVGGMLGGDSERQVTLAAAIELLHTATLVHDDLIDGAFLRRGMATLNSQWSPAATVLTGDFLFARAARLAALTGSVIVMQVFADTLATIVSGELTQLFADKSSASRENYERRIYSKTASMFELATEAAALLSEAGRSEVEALRRFGYSLGMAFQIVDDVFDFSAEQATVGKPVAGDLRQGLITLPALYYLDAVPDDPAMMALLRGERPDESEMQRLIVAIRSGAALRLSMEEAAGHIERALEILESFSLHGPERKALEHMARYIVNRQF